jgi:hypothetical protein
MAGVAVASSALVSFALADSVAENRDWAAVAIEELVSARPWRTFRWYRGQQHYSGVFWSATVHGHVVYESRLELARLLYADFDPAVHGITAQPFLLTCVVDGVLRRHIPDYLLVTAAGPVVVDVKPREQASKPKNAFTFAWTRRMVESRGWRYEVWCEPPSDELENIRFLAGYRRRWLFDPALLEALRCAGLGGMRFGDAPGTVPAWPQPLVRAAVLHLLWTGHLATDLDRPLSAGHVLREAG